MTKNTILRGGAGIAAAVALAAGGVAISSGSSTPSSPTSVAGNHTLPGGPNGAPPAGGRGFGTPVTGTAAAKARAAALARYPGNVERVMRSPSGAGYEVHVITSDGSEVHVLVSAAFQVTGTETGGPPQGQTGPSQGGTPQLTPPTSSGSTT